MDSQVQSNGTTLVIGDLDSAGYLPEVNLQAQPALLVTSAPSGTPSKIEVIEVKGLPASPAVPIGVSIANRPSWLSVTSDSATTPVQLTLTFDAATLPPGTYSTSLLVSSSSPLVLVQPLVIPISFVVTAGLIVLPTAMAFIFDGCPASGTQTQSLLVQAPSGTPFSVSLLSVSADAAEAVSPDVQWPSSVPWLSATSASANAPNSVQLTADAAKVPGGATSAAARAIVMASGGSNSLARTIPVTYLCATSKSWLPFVAR